MLLTPLFYALFLHFIIVVTIISLHFIFCNLPQGFVSSTTTTSTTIVVVILTSITRLFERRRPTAAVVYSFAAWHRSVVVSSTRCCFPRRISPGLALRCVVTIRLGATYCTTAETEKRRNGSNFTVESMSSRLTGPNRQRYDDDGPYESDTTLLFLRHHCVASTMLATSSCIFSRPNHR